MNIIPRKYYDDLFDNFLSVPSNDNMKCDIYEKDGDYHIEMDIPGFNKEDIKIECNNGYLTISAEKKNEVNEEDEEKNYIRRERTYGSYQRQFYLGDVEVDNVKASFKDGTLKITVPKKEEVDTKKLIDIE